VAAWGAVSAVYLFKVWRGIGGMGARQTARHARQDDPGRAVMDLMLLAAALASVVDVVYVLAASRTMSASARSIHAVGAVVSVALTWTVVHTLFTLRYARLFHQHRCGLDFNSPLSPTYRDFAYVAFTVGMTYQVSDTTTMTAAIRREVLRHALLSYVFGTFVLASVVNLLVGLVA
jgi:uncharacterized membrane protein